MPEASPTNPYEPPREIEPLKPNFGNGGNLELADLQRRITDLERRLKYSWVVHPNFFLRTFAVFGYWLVGYAVLAAIGALIMLMIKSIRTFD